MIDADFAGSVEQPLEQLGIDPRELRPRFGVPGGPRPVRQRRRFASRRRASRRLVTGTFRRYGGFGPGFRLGLRFGPRYCRLGGQDLGIGRRCRRDIPEFVGQR